MPRKFKGPEGEYSPRPLDSYRTARGHLLEPGAPVFYLPEEGPGIAQPTQDGGPMVLAEILEHPTASGPWIEAVLNKGAYSTTADNLVPAEAARVHADPGGGWHLEAGPLSDAGVDAEAEADAAAGPDFAGTLPDGRAFVADLKTPPRVFPPGCGLPGCRHHYGRNMAAEGCVCPSWFDSGGWHLTAVNAECGAHVGDAAAVIDAEEVRTALALEAGRPAARRAGRSGRYQATTSPRAQTPPPALPTQPGRRDNRAPAVDPIRAAFDAAIAEAEAGDGSTSPEWARLARLERADRVAALSTLTAEAYAALEAIDAGRWDPFLPVIAKSIRARGEAAWGEAMARIRAAGGDPENPDDPAWAAEAAWWLPSRWYEGHADPGRRP